MSEHNETKPSGNAAKLREALEKIRSNLTMTYQSEEEERDLIVEAFNIAGEALAEPPRNCDVGTPDEQSARYESYCFDNRSMEKCCGDCLLLPYASCELAWAQLPYESEADDGDASK